MKKKFLFLVAVIAIAVASMVNSADATVAVSDCPNGCLANGDGCWCYTWYPCYLEGPSAQEQLAMN